MSDDTAVQSISDRRREGRSRAPTRADPLRNLVICPRSIKELIWFVGVASSGHQGWILVLVVLNMFVPQMQPRRLFGDVLGEARRRLGDASETPRRRLRDASSPHIWPGISCTGCIANGASHKQAHHARHWVLSAPILSSPARPWSCFCRDKTALSEISAVGSRVVHPSVGRCVPNTWLFLNTTVPDGSTWAPGWRRLYPVCDITEAIAHPWVGSFARHHPFGSRVSPRHAAVARESYQTCQRVRGPQQASDICN